MYVQYCMYISSDVLGFARAIQPCDQAGPECSKRLKCLKAWNGTWPAAKDEQRVNAAFHCGAVAPLLCLLGFTCIYTFFFGAQPPVPPPWRLLALAANLLRNIANYSHTVHMHVCIHTCMYVLYIHTCKTCTPTVITTALEDCHMVGLNYLPASNVTP
jgi:hypothetical protein